MARKVDIKLTPTDPKLLDQYPRETWEEQFFEALGQYGIISDACRAAAIPVNLVVSLRKSDPDFALRFEDTMDSVRDKVRRALMERSIDGVVKPVYQLGKLVGYEVEHDNKLLMFVAERLLRDEFHLEKEKAIGTGTPIRFEFVLGEKPDVEGEIEDAEMLEIESSSRVDEHPPDEEKM